MKRFVTDERADVPVGTILVVGLVVTPCILALVIFRVEVWTWLVDQFTKVVERDDRPSPFGS